jgi:hypothetical protein
MYPYLTSTLFCQICSEDIMALIRAGRTIRSFISRCKAPAVSHAVNHNFSQLLSHLPGFCSSYPPQYHTRKIIHRSYAVTDPKEHCASGKLVPDILIFQKDKISTMLPQVILPFIWSNARFAWQLHNSCHSVARYPAVTPGNRIPTNRLCIVSWT